MTPVLPQPLPQPNTISRDHAVSKRAPKLTTNKTFTFWRNRTRSHRPKKRVLTAGDRLVQAKKREQHRHEYYNALEHAQATVQELAEGLRNRFGKYSVDHYFNDLIHRAHKSRSTRKVNPWNTYQKLELEQIKCRLFMTSIARHLTWLRLQVKPVKPRRISISQRSTSRSVINGRPFHLLNARQSLWSRSEESKNNANVKNSWDTVSHSTLSMMRGVRFSPLKPR